MGSNDPNLTQEGLKVSDKSKPDAPSRADRLTVIPSVGTKCLYAWYSQIAINNGNATFIYLRPDGSEIEVSVVAFGPQRNVKWDWPDIQPMGRVIEFVRQGRIRKPTGFTSAREYLRSIGALPHQSVAAATPGKAIGASK